MQTESLTGVDTKRCVSVIMGGGAGTRLFPLTKDRSKPAVPLGGKYRLVDIPISNCLNSGLRKIYLLTQFNSSSLHRHIQRAYKFDEFSAGFVEIMAAQQTQENKTGWYQGTADAVRVNLRHFDNDPHDYVVILSGDQLYRMDYREVLAQHQRLGSDITVAVLPVQREPARSFGIMDIDEKRRITRFVEKPNTDALLDDLRPSPVALKEAGCQPGEDLYLASMGIYVFNRSILHEVLNNTLTDFGKDIIPGAISRYKVDAYVFRGYWEDLGTIKAFFHANLDMCEQEPAFDWHGTTHPLFTRLRNLPPNKIASVTLDKVALCTGCTLEAGTTLRRVVVGNRTMIGRSCQIEDTILLGADYYESENPGQAQALGIGEGTRIRQAIIDKNARIGKNCVITPDGKPDNMDHPLYYMRDGIVVVAKDTTIPDNTVI